MEYEELKKRNSLLLLQDVDFKYVIYPITKEEKIDLELSLEDYRLGVGYVNDYTAEDKFDFIKMVNMCGCINEVTEKDCRDIIPLSKVHIVKNSQTDIEKTFEYKCYTKSDKSKLIIHEDRLSSFKCACEKIGSRYFVVLREFTYEKIVKDVKTVLFTNLTQKDIEETLKDVIKNGTM
jgi:hypothetical protein